MATKGRPTKYDKKYIDEVEVYLAECTDTSTVDNQGKTWNVNLPTVEGFARRIGVHKDTLYAWSQEHKDFSDSLSQIVAEQQTRLINKGLAGVYNPTITKLILSANHGMAEKTTSEQKITHSLDEEYKEKAKQAVIGYLGE